jgi:hypothetical protein
MLRKRKKPPVDWHDINAGKPWSSMDLAAHDEVLTDGKSAASIADYLCRPVQESRPRSPHSSTEMLVRSVRPIGFIEPCQPTKPGDTGP